MADYVAQEGGLIEDGRVVPAGHGWSWIASAWRLFRAAPRAWMLILLLYVLITGACAAVPLLGSLAVALLAPVLGGGIMAGCAAQDRGKGLRVGYLFAGFQHRTKQLVAVGALYLAGFFAIVMITGSMFGGLFFLRLANAPDPRIALLAMLVVAALSLPLMMAIWFAPALTMLHDVSAWQAMRSSFRGCLKNVVPFLVYSAVLLACAAIVMIPAVQALGPWSAQQHPPAIAVMLLVLGFLVLGLVIGPIVMASAYTAYRDIFIERTTT